MDNKIYKFLLYIKNNNKLPQPEELELEKEVLNNIVKKCSNEGLLDKNIVYVNILGIIECDEPELAITIKGYRYLDEHNPIGELS